MAFNRNKILTKAQKLLQRGKTKEAIVEYQVIVDNDPTDVRTLLKIGDLQAKIDDIAAAAATYESVGQYYSKDGFFLKAVAVYKQILKVDPSLVGTYVKLAELYQQLGLKSEALKQYQTAVKYFESNGLVKKSLDILKKMSLLEPEDFSSRMKLVELYIREGHEEDASHTCKEIISDLKERALFDELSQVYEKMRVLGISKEEEEFELIETYLESNEPQKALKNLQGFFERDPKNIRILDLLARCFSALEQMEKAKSIYEEILLILNENGSEEEKNQYQARLRALDVMVDDGDGILDQDYEISSQVSSEAVEPGAEEKPGVTVEEIDTYLEYGLYEKSIDVISLELKKNPQRIDLISKLEEIAKNESVAERANSILKVFEPVASSESTVGGATNVSPVEPEQKIAVDATAPSLNADINVNDFEMVEEDLEIDWSDDGFTLDTEASSEDVVANDSLKSPEEQSPSVLNTAEEDSEVPMKLELEPILNESELEIPSSQVEVGHEHAEAEAEGMELALETPSSESFKGDGFVLQEPVLDIDIDSEELEEVEINNVHPLSRSEEVEPPLVQEELVVSSPEEPVANVEPVIPAATTKPKVVAVEPEESGDFFDLSDELSSEIHELEQELAKNEDKESDPLSQEEVISEFKKGVARVVSRDDFQTHYNLGIAYKEMGLLDEALSEFKVASQDIELLADCSSMIGLCLISKRDYPTAIEVYKKALEQIATDSQAYLGLNYELAEAFIGYGKVKEAYEAFKRVFDQDASFRDVKRRTKELELEFTSTKKKIAKSDASEEVEVSEDQKNKVSFI